MSVVMLSSPSRHRFGYHCFKLLPQQQIVPLKLSTFIQEDEAQHPRFRTFTAAQASTSMPGPDPPKESLIKKLGWDPESLKADSSYNRWLMLPSCTLNHICLGSVFAWSIFNQPLMHLNGVVAPSALDWSYGDISITFSLIMGGFVWGGVFGKKLDEFGPRVSCLIGAGSLLSGFSLASLGVATHNLPLLYLGGAVFGVSNGFSYTPPVATLIKWFPDRKGFASGAVILGYGGGSMIAAPLFSALLNKFTVLPEYAGADPELINQDGQLFVDTASGLREVVVATASDLKNLGLDEIADAGAYFVGSGSTGIAETFLCLGALYSLTMAANCFVFRLPPDNYVPPGLETSSEEKSSQVLTRHNVELPEAMSSTQFWLLYLGFGSSITGAYGILSSGKLLLTEAFASNLPDIATATFTSGFVSVMGAANLGGRIVWPMGSDYVANARGDDPFFARKYTYTTMWTLTPFLYGGMLWSVHSCVMQPSTLSLTVFCGSLLGILSVFGGSTAGRPAIIGDLFGLKNLGVLTARQLSVVLPAAFIGPKIVSYSRETGTKVAIEDLTAKVDDASFMHSFGASKDSLDILVDSNTVTIPRLLELLPEGTVDPTPLTYDNAFLVLGALQIVALASNLALRPLVKS